MGNRFLELKYVFKLLLNFTNPSNFQSLEAVDLGSETQLQLTENFNLKVEKL